MTDAHSPPSSNNTPPSKGIMFPLLGHSAGPDGRDGLASDANLLAHRTHVGGSNVDSHGVVPVTVPILILSAAPLLAIAYVGHKYEMGLENTLLVGILRSFVQLTILGWILHPIFGMGIRWPWIVFLYVLFMILIATKESMSRPKYTYQYHAHLTFLALLLSIAGVGAFAFLVIILPDPRWDPQYVIPICGMLMGNCINGVSLTVNNLSTSIMEGGRREVELLLSFGASGWESVGRLVREAVRAGVTPMLNSLNVIGLVSIPGMMTGQILGGSPVTEAAHYQILIMYLIATCTFCTIFTNVFIIYRVAFDAGTHVLRTDRFFKANKKKKAVQTEQSGGIVGNLIGRIQNCCSIGLGCAKSILCFCGLFGRQLDTTAADISPGALESQPLSNLPESTYGSENRIPSNKIQIQTSRIASYGSNEPFFRITGLQFSVPESNAKKRPRGNSDAQSLTLPPSPGSLSYNNGGSAPNPEPSIQQRRILCINLNANLKKGEIGIVSGPSGSGKSTFFRVLAGLSPMDHGDVTMPGLSLAGCCGQGGRVVDHNSMIQWRTAVRYVTQYKVDIPGTPRDFVGRIAMFSSYNTSSGREFGTPSKDEMIAETLSYLQRWGMVDVGAVSDQEGERHQYLDKEWKDLSGGESQRTLLAISMATRPLVLLMDEATSGLDAKTEKCVEKSIIEYIKRHQAAVYWITHSEDIAERLLRH